MPEMRMSGNFRTFPNRLQRSRRELLNCLERAMRDAIEVGVDTGRDVIETSGTDTMWEKPWGGRDGGGRGRVNTGHMRDEFRGDIDYDRSEVRGKVGWIDEQADYFFYQDQGFFHVLAQREIEGMYALREASEEAWDVLRAESKKCMEKAVNAI